MTGDPYLLACSLVILAVVPATAFTAWQRIQRHRREYRRWKNRTP